MIGKKFFALLLATTLAIPGLGAANVYAAEKENVQINTEASADGYYGLRPDPTSVEAATAAVDTESRTSLPKSYRNKNLNKVRSQDPYGTCWAFATLGMAEADLINDGVKSPDLSELHLAYFTYKSVLDPLGGLAGDSNYVDDKSKDFLTLGGDIAQTLYTMIAWKGAVKESDASYKMAEEARKKGISSSLCYNDYAHLQNAYVINIKKNPEGVKKMVMEHGAVAINYCESSKYYYESTNCYYTGKKYSSNHSVTIVGWNDNFSKNNFKGSSKPSKDGAWLIRNSWGKTEDCHAGYFWMSYEEPSIASNAYAFDMVLKGKEGYYQNNYQYDGSFSNAYMVYARDTMSYANVFEAKASDSEILKAVAVRFCEADAEYTVDIYKDLENETDPTSGQLVSTTEGKISYEGYYTIKLDTAVELSRGDKYSVVVTHNGGSQDGTPVAIEGNFAWTGVWVAKASAKEGQSFVKSGQTWKDFGAQQNANIRIKAFTDNAEEEKIKDYDISYELNGGIQNPANPVTYTAGKGATLYEPTREGMIFSGWYIDEALDNKVSAISAKTEGDVTLYAGWNAMTAKDVGLGKTEITKLRAGSKYIELNWKKVDKADGYIVYKKTDSGNWKRLTILSNANTVKYYDQSKLKNGSKYQYKVTAYVEFEGETIKNDSATKTIVFLTEPGIKDSSRSNATTITVTLKKNTKASGYEIQTAKTEKFKSAKKTTVKKASQTKVTLKGVKKKYYIRIRAYKKVGKVKYYSDWKVYRLN